MKLTIFCVAMSLLAGCATHPMLATRPDTDGYQANKDLRECKYDALRSANAVDQSYSSEFGQALELALRQRDIMKECMIARGYSWN